MFVTSYWDILEPVTSPLHTLTLVTSALPCYSWTITQVYIILILCPSPLKYSFKYTYLAFNVQMWFCCNWVAYNAIAEEWHVIAYGAPFAIVVGLHRVYTPLVVSEHLWTYYISYRTNLFHWTLASQQVCMGGPQGGGQYSLPHWLATTDQFPRSSEHVQLGWWATHSFLIALLYGSYRCGMLMDLSGWLTASASTTVNWKARKRSRQSEVH